MIRYAITSGNASRSQDKLLADARRWATAGVDFVQLREKWMDAGPLLELATAMAAIFREHGNRTKLLVNSRADVAIAAHADGVHLTSHEDELTSDQVRHVFATAGRPQPIVSVSCHSLEDVRRASEAKPDIILFGPVFEKRVAGEVVVTRMGTDGLREACIVAGATPVLALGGVTGAHLPLCLDAGAAGVAGIRIFEVKNDILT
jgi:thiamine-phosphate pyrophosphorylase